MFDSDGNMKEKADKEKDKLPNYKPTGKQLDQNQKLKNKKKEKEKQKKV